MPDDDFDDDPVVARLLDAGGEPVAAVTASGEWAAGDPDLLRALELHARARVPRLSGVSAGHAAASIAARDFNFVYDAVRPHTPLPDGAVG